MNITKLQACLLIISFILLFFTPAWSQVFKNQTQIKNQMEFQWQNLKKIQNKSQNTDIVFVVAKWLEPQIAYAKGKFNIRRGDMEVVLVGPFYNLPAKLKFTQTEKILESKNQNQIVQIKPGKSNDEIEKEKQNQKMAMVAIQPVESWKQEIINEIMRYPWDGRIAVAIAMAESGLRADAIGDTHIYPHSYGVFQIRALAGRPAPEQLMDYRINIAYAYQLWLSSGWNPWSVWKSGIYLHYLN